MVLFKGSECNDIGMSQPHRHERFAFHLVVRALVAHQAARQHLDGELRVVELRVLDKPHRTHLALPKLADNPVAVREERTFIPCHRHSVVDGVDDH